MPKYLVRLAAPVIYQPDSLKAMPVTELPVHSATESAAISHVHRTTRGDVQILSVETLKP